MQYFSIKDILLSFLFFFATCSQSEPAVFSGDRSNSTTQLAVPKDDGEEDYRDVATKLTLILVDTEKLYAYEGNALNDGAYLRYNELRSLVNQSKKKFPEKDFVVVIKTAPKATYKSTVDVLDEMTINKIQRYSINDLFPEEKQKLGLE